MAQVPYSPVPRVSPESRPTPGLSLNTPGAAFGANIGEAKTHFGAQLERTGDVLGREALHFQQIRNETWAKENDVAYMVEESSLLNDYFRKEGSNAPNALPDLQQKIQSIRQKYLEAAPNQEARRMLDGTISYRAGTALDRAGRHAGTEAKLAYRRAGEARTQTAVDTADASNPKDFNGTTVKTIEAEIRQQGADRGDSAETIDHAVTAKTSKAALNAITKNAPVDPIAAQTFLGSVKDKMLAADRDQAQGIVNRNMASHQSRDDARAILSGLKAVPGGPEVPAFDPAKGPGQVDAIVKEAKRVAAIRGKDNPDYEDALMHRVQTDIALGNKLYNDAHLNAKFTLQRFVMGEDEGKRKTSIDAISSDPQMSAQWQVLSPPEQASIRRMIEKNVKDEVVHPTYEGNQRFETIMGMRSSTAERRREFMELSIDDESKLTHRQRMTILNEQQRFKDRASPDSSINQYLGNARVRTVIKALQLTPGEPSYDRFVGALEVEANQKKEENGGKLNDKDLHEIAQKISQKVVKEGSWFDLTGATPRFLIDVPEKEIDKIKGAFQRAYGREPTQPELQREYIEQYKLKEYK